MKYEVNSHLFSQKLSSILLKRGMMDKKGKPDKVALYNLLFPNDLITEKIRQTDSRLVVDKTRNISNWLKGNNYPKTISDILALCNALDCDLDYFFSNMNARTHDIEFISKETGLSDITIEEIMCLSVSEKHIIDAIFSRSAISISIIKTIQEMLFYSHPLAKNNSYIQLDKSLTARDKDYEQLEMKLNENQIIDILSQRLSIEMREIIEILSKDKKLSDEILEDYRNKFFTYHRHALTAAELPTLITDENGNLIEDIEKQIYETEEKILNRLEKRDKKGKTFDYGIDIRNYSDFKKCIQQYRLEKTKKDYLSWLKHIDSETE